MLYNIQSLSWITIILKICFDTDTRLSAILRACCSPRFSFLVSQVILKDCRRDRELSWMKTYGERCWERVWVKESRRRYLNYNFVDVVKSVVVSLRLPLVVTNARFATSSIWFILSSSSRLLSLPSSTSLLKFPFFFIYFDIFLASILLSKPTSKTFSGLGMKTRTITVRGKNRHWQKEKHRWRYLMSGKLERGIEDGSVNG